MPLSREDLEQYVRTRAFHSAHADEKRLRVGIEVEFIPLRSSDHLRVPVENEEGTGFADLLRAHGTPLGWQESRSSKGAPVFVVHGAGTFTFEPGGQVEFSTSAGTSANAALDSLDRVLAPLTSAAAERGIELIHRGLDPFNSIDRVPLRICAPRYLAMQEYFESIGPFGIRMMRQTAAHQVNLDLGVHPFARWRILNRLAPYVVAIFANSRAYAGSETGHQSARAHVWRQLDPLRTGTLPESDDPAGTYLEFALGAPVMTRRSEAGEYQPFRDWLDAGDVSHDDWEDHLTTLFPEVRPKGYLEVRSADAIAPEWYPAPVVLLAGIAYHPPTLAEADRLMDEPDADLLVRAGQLGLKDPAIARVSRDLVRLALDGCAQLGESFISGAHLERARAYFDRYTLAGESPADDGVV